MTKVIISAEQEATNPTFNVAFREDEYEYENGTFSFGEKKNRLAMFTFCGLVVVILGLAIALGITLNSDTSNEEGNNGNDVSKTTTPPTQSPSSLPTIVPTFSPTSSPTWIVPNAVHSIEEGRIGQGHDTSLASKDGFRMIRKDVDHVNVQMMSTKYDTIWENDTPDYQGIGNITIGASEEFKPIICPKNWFISKISMTKKALEFAFYCSEMKPGSQWKDDQPRFDAVRPTCSSNTEFIVAIYPKSTDAINFEFAIGCMGIATTSQQIT